MLAAQSRTVPKTDPSIPDGHSRRRGVSERRRLATPLDAAELAELRNALGNPGELEPAAAHLLHRFLLVDVVNGTLGSLSLHGLLQGIVALAAETVDADRGTIFLFDKDKGELFSLVAQGEEIAEIRIPASTGIAGAVFASGLPEIVHEAEADPRFNPTVDQLTGYQTKSIACAPLRNLENEVVGVVEVLNRRSAQFTPGDLALLDLIGAQVSAALTNAQLVESRRQKTRATMARYMATEFLEHVLAGDGAAVSGAAQTATVLFSDIRHFTTLAEAMSPQATVALLNEYFAEMVDTVMHHGGVIDKYLGDGVMAVFGALTPSVTDADQAVAAAVEMLRSLRRLNKTRASRSAPPIEIGVGLASGEIVAGSIGSTKRMDYTVIGDSVNLAARIESANKTYQTAILLCGSTAASLRSSTPLREIDLVRVKGKDNPISVFEALGHHTDESFPDMARILELFADGVRRYRARDWTGALGRFGSVIELMPSDGPSWVYTDRCLFYRDNPPRDGWDGVWTMEQK